MGQIVSPETLVFNLKETPVNYPKEDNFNIMNHGESLKLNIYKMFQFVETTGFATKEVDTDIVGSSLFLLILFHGDSCK
jgi:hypothetical protein